MSRFDSIFDDGDYYECSKCSSLMKIDENGKLMRMILNEEGLPVIYEEKNKGDFIDKCGNLKCNCSD